MKLEKINDNQIRCTLTKADLADRQLKISELAYGTEKAKRLFRDMMQQASYEFGFEADDIPLMIEAIPISGESILLIITKVEDPEELDTRFSNFAPSITGEDDSFPLGRGSSHKPLDFDTFQDLIRRCADNPSEIGNFEDFKNLLKNVSDASVLEETAFEESEVDDCKSESELIKAFAFCKLKEIEDFSKIAVNCFTGSSWLYKDKKNHRYLLYISQKPEAKNDFYRICNICTEYGKVVKGTLPDMDYLNEQGCLIINGNAIEQMAKASS